MTIAAEYDVDYFIAKFEEIPEELWGEKDYNLGEGKFCVLGHCGITHMHSTPEGKALRMLFGTGATIISINDGKIRVYQQPTPKQRVLAALADMKKKRNKEEANS